MITFVSLGVKRDYVLVIVWRLVRGRAVGRTVTHRGAINMIDLAAMIVTIKDVRTRVLYQVENHLSHLRSPSCAIFVVVSIRLRVLPLTARTTWMRDLKEQVFVKSIQCRCPIKSVKTLGGMSIGSGRLAKIVVTRCWAWLTPME
jgi:hypothetical protein